MDEERRAGSGRTGLLLLAMGACLVLIVLGMWQGDFHETLMNGTVL